MQPLPGPDDLLAEWLFARKLVAPDVLRDARRRHAIAGRTSTPPSLPAFLESEGLLTREQREAAERDLPALQAAASAARHATLAAEERRRPRKPGEPERRP